MNENLTTKDSGQQQAPHLRVGAVSGCLYTFLYCDCIYESSYATISTHYSMQGAYKAMRTFLLKQYEEWYNNRIIYGKGRNPHSVDKFGRHEAWTVGTIQVLP
jgi:hypothetical protein